ncbi:MAG TPA: Chromate resistance protein ChrB [Gemmatimonadales bacterium]|nr:Chromate resistance protein ChrB [Gemmatimonadales bacterium]
MAADWLLCTYRLPREPSRLRLGVWRRLRRLGAVMLHDGLWILPADGKTREDFEWLADEILERGGSVLLWEARSLDAEQDAAVARRFRDEAAERYAELAEAAAQLARVARKRALPAATREQVLQRLRGLERGLRLERRRDYFRATGRQEAEAVVQRALQVVRTGSVPKKVVRRQRAVGD